uniref:Uncharacterized protein n=1 Tax=Psilocybe cubensis TaxID=181762 RepID=A0A8H7XSW0_PSICU
MSSRDQVDSLLAIIKEAAYNALDEYETYGTPAPNLDSLEPHPLDVADDKLRLKKIISKLEGACDQLCTILAPPSHTVMNRAQDFGWACLRVSVRQKIADELAQHPDGLHVDELSKKVNVHPMKLASILRVLAARHCFREVLPNSFANNRLSMNLVSDHSVSALVNLVTEEGQRSALALSDYVVDPEYGYSLDISKAVFQYRNKDVMPKGLTFYEWLQSSVRHSRY